MDPVVIPALTPTLDKTSSLIGPCVQSIIWTGPQISGRIRSCSLSLSKKASNKDISPATISSWINQTVILCYELSDQVALTLHQVKAHDFRAFAASKAFQSGVSLEQILSACYWKSHSHNTFAQFYLKDVAWADSELLSPGTCSGCSADPPVTHIMEEICTYVNSCIYI